MQPGRRHLNRSSQTCGSRTSLAQQLRRVCTSVVTEAVQAVSSMTGALHKLGWLGHFAGRIGPAAFWQSAVARSQGTGALERKACPQKAIYHCSSCFECGTHSRSFLHQGSVNSSKAYSHRGSETGENGPVASRFASSGGIFHKLTRIIRNSTLLNACLPVDNIVIYQCSNATSQATAAGTLNIAKLITAALIVALISHYGLSDLRKVGCVRLM